MSYLTQSMSQSHFREEKLETQRYWIRCSKPCNQWMIQLGLCFQSTFSCMDMSQSIGYKPGSQQDMFSEVVRAEKQDSGPESWDDPCVLICLWVFILALKVLCPSPSVWGLLSPGKLRHLVTPQLTASGCALGQFSHSVMSDTLWPHGLQHASLPWPSPTPGACSNSCPSSWWCCPTVSSSVVPFSPCL